MPNPGEKLNVMEMAEDQRDKYRRYLISHSKASWLLRRYSVGEALARAGL